MKVAVLGFKGRMGHEVVKTVLREADLELVAVLDHAPQEKNINEIAEFSDLDVPVFDDLEKLLTSVALDAVVDFTTPKVGYSNTKLVLTHGVSPVVGTTGFTPEQITELTELAASKKNWRDYCSKFCGGGGSYDAICAKSGEILPRCGDYRIAS